MSDIGKICICIGVILLAILAVLYFATEEKNKEVSNRANRSSNAGNNQALENGMARMHREIMDNSQAESFSVTLPPLPPRVPLTTGSVTGTANNNTIRARRRTAVAPALPDKPVIRTRGGNAGANGVSLYQFPCCPIDKQRNIPGKSQLISWDKKHECYVCSRGHKFKSNGKPIYV